MSARRHGRAREHGPARQAATGHGGSAQSQKNVINASLLRSLKKLPCTARNVALQALLRVDAGQSAQQALSEALDQRRFFADCFPAAHFPNADNTTQLLTQRQSAEFPSKERHLCSELVYGCLRAEIRIACVLGKVLPRPQALPRPMLRILALAIYSLLFQERVPAHAAVHTAVEQVDSLFGSALARVANAALRSVQRLEESPLRPAFYGKERWASLANYYSVPLWLAEIWRVAYGEEAALALMQRSFERPWSALRINPLHMAAADLRAALLTLPKACAVGAWGVAFMPGALPEWLLERKLSHWQAAGALSLQSAGSQTILEALELLGWREPVWDACAGYGGKSAALMERGVPVSLCTDRAFSRLRALPKLCRRLRLPVPATVLADGTRPPLARWSGHILLDAPCSGLGVLARRPDIRRRGQEHLAELEELQARLLFRLAGLLDSGRELAYITCTLNPAENEKVVERLLREGAGLRLLRQWQTPHTHPWLEGMYGAVLRRV